MVKAVLFDLDDTLYGDFDVCDQMGMHAAGVYLQRAIGLDAQQAADVMQKGREMMRKRCPDEPEMHDRVLFAKLGLESIGINPIRYAEGMHAAYWDTVYNQMKRRPGVAKLLGELQQAQIPVGICTNMMADVQMKKLCRLGLDEICGTLISSEEAGKDKPHPQIFELACERLGTCPEETLMVGDSIQHDIQGALRMSMPAIWLNWKNKPVPELDAPFFVANTFPEVAAQVLELCGLEEGEE